MSYTTEDFAESLERVDVERSSIASVIAAWGTGSGMGEDAGHYRWSNDGATEWSGGFLFSLNDGRFAYLTGWCDYTGWGCQDGADIYHFDARPTLDEVRAVAHTDTYHQPPMDAEWDTEPADLNLWIKSKEKP